MKTFAIVIIAAAIIGGFIGGELSGKSFSAIGATIAGFGIASAIFFIGRHLASKESKSLPELTPDILEVFRRIYKSPDSSSSSKWKPRPFFENKTEADYLDWFSNVPPWNKVDTVILKFLINKFAGNPLFEVFVHASNDHSLIDKYIELNEVTRDQIGQYMLGPMIAMTLSNASDECKMEAEKQIERRNFPVVKEKLGRAIDLAESALVIEPDSASSYIQMAILKALLGRKKEAARYCHAGLKVIEEQRNIPFEQSKSPNIRSVQAENERIAARLKLLLEKVSD